MDYRPQWNDKEFEITSAPVDPLKDDNIQTHTIWAPSEKVARERFARAHPDRYYQIVGRVIYI